SVLSRPLSQANAFKRPRQSDRRLPTKKRGHEARPRLGNRIAKPPIDPALARHVAAYDQPGLGIDRHGSERFRAHFAEWLFTPSGFHRSPHQVRLSSQTYVVPNHLNEVESIVGGREEPVVSDA